MRLASLVRTLPPRLTAGAFILNSGVGKLSADEETAARLHGMAASTYPFLGTMKPQDFARLLAAGEIAVGTTLLLPVVPAGLAGLALTAFSGGLIGLYLRTPGMRMEGSLRPTQQGVPLAKDVWLVGIGDGLMLDSLTDSLSSRGQDSRAGAGPGAPRGQHRQEADDGLDGTEDVDHEDQGVGALDARLGAAGLAVAVSGRDDQHDPAAHGLADQALVPAGDDLARGGPDGEAERLAPAPRGVEYLAGPPDRRRRTGSTTVWPFCTVAPEPLISVLTTSEDGGLWAEDGMVMVGAAPAFAVTEGSEPPPLVTWVPVAEALFANSLIMSTTNTRVSVAVTPAEELPLFAVAVRGRDHGQHPAAHLLALQRRLQAGQQLPAEQRRALGGERALGELVGLPAPDVHGVVADEGIRLGQGRAAPLDQGLDRELAGWPTDSGW